MADQTNPAQPVTAPVTPPVAPVAASAAGVAYGGFWARFAAVLIDGILLNVVTAPILGFGNRNGGITGVSFLITMVYSVVMLGSPWQATVGKKALGLKVTTLDGNKVPYDKLVIRELAKILSAIILGIGYLMMLWDPKKQTLHDRIAGTLVVKSK